MNNVLYMQHSEEKLSWCHNKCNSGHISIGIVNMNRG